MEQPIALTAQHIIATLKEAERVLLVVHQHPDGDTLGAGNALGLWLQSEGKDIAIFCATPAGPDFDYLPLTKKFGSSIGILLLSSIQVI